MYCVALLCALPSGEARRSGRLLICLLWIKGDLAQIPGGVHIYRTPQVGLIEINISWHPLIFSLINPRSWSGEECAYWLHLHLSWWRLVGFERPSVQNGAKMGITWEEIKNLLKEAIDHVFEIAPYVFQCFSMFSPDFPCFPCFSLFFPDSLAFPCFSMFSPDSPCFPVFSYVFPWFPMFFSFFLCLLILLVSPCFSMFSSDSPCFPTYSTIFQFLRFCFKESFVI